MNQRTRGKISGTYPKAFPAAIQSEGPVSALSLQDVLDAIGQAMETYDCRKTFSLVMPKGMGRDEAVSLIKRGAYRITETRREIEIRIGQEM